MFVAFVRLFVVILALAGLAVLFFYAFVAALIITPILFVLFGRKSMVQWSVVRPGAYPPTAYSNEPPRRPGPVIDHDPNDLPRSDPPPR